MRHGKGITITHKPYVPDVNASVSWWLEAGPDAFTARALAELPRMRTNRVTYYATLGEVAEVRKRQAQRAYQDEAA